MRGYDLLGMLVRAVVALAALGGSTYLGVRGALNPQGVVGIYTAVIALYGSAAIRAAATLNGNGGKPNDRR